MLSEEPGDLIAAETIKVEQVGRVWSGDGQIGKIDLVPVGVLLAPESQPQASLMPLPSCSAFEPFPKSGERGRAVTASGVVVAEFVVDLPAGDRGMDAVAAGELPADRAASRR